MPFGKFYPNKASAGKTERSRSDIEPEKYDVPVANLVILPLKPHLPGFPHQLLGTFPHVILVGYGLGPYEAPFEIAVDNPGRLGRPGSLPDRPGPYLFRPRGEIGKKPEIRVRAVNKPVKAGIAKPEFLKKSLLLLAPEFSYLGLYLGRNNDNIIPRSCLRALSPS